MTDRELLELAAKAAGLELHWEHDRPQRIELFRGHLPNFEDWNPLTDDGDALRLAVRLHIDVCFGANYVIARGSVQNPTVNNANDPCAATRYAIVRAAAEMAK